MNDLRINGIQIPPSVSLNKAAGVQQQEGNKTFGSILKESINEVNQLQSNANKSIDNLMVDKSASIHETMIAMEKAGVSFQTVLVVRNKALEAYQEVMRMQI
jgi:flagellar hook-basal body complex protein FliE